MYDTLYYVVFLMCYYTMQLHCTCPECKNDVDFSNYANLTVGTVIECDVCGITLEVRFIGEDGTVETEIVDEGK